MNGQTLLNVPHQDAIKMLRSSDTLMLTVRVEEVYIHVHVYICIHIHKYSIMHAYKVLASEYFTHV